MQKILQKKPHYIYLMPWAKTDLSAIKYKKQWTGVKKENLL